MSFGIIQNELTGKMDEGNSQLKSQLKHHCTTNRFSAMIFPSCIPLVNCDLFIYFLVHSSGAMVQFSNRLGGSIKHDFDERSNGLFDGR